MSISGCCEMARLDCQAVWFCLMALDCVTNGDALTHILELLLT